MHFIGRQWFVKASFSNSRKEAILGSTDPKRRHRSREEKTAVYLAGPRSLNSLRTDKLLEFLKIVFLRTDLPWYDLVVERIFYQ